MQLTVLRESRDCERWRVSGESGEILQAALRVFPDASLDLSELGFCKNLARNVAKPAAKLLFDHAVGCAAQNHLRYVRFIDWDSVESDHKSSLKSAGFIAATQIQQWVCSVAFRPPSSGSRLSVRRLDLDNQLRDSVQLRPEQRSISRKDRHATLVHLLERCFTDSEDLAGLPTPTANMLLATWDALQDAVMLLVAHSGDEDVGIAVVSNGGLGSGCTLEYLAVVPEQRRRGVATQLLIRILESARCSSAGGSSGRNEQEASREVPLTAWCDGRNSAAVEFYRKNEFTCLREARLWIRRI